MIFIHSLCLMFILYLVLQWYRIDSNRGSTVYSKVSKVNYGMFGRMMF